MVSIVYTIILIVCFVFLRLKISEVESNFPLKIIGYFILGSFALIINEISLPLGFIVYLLFLRPTLNIDIKRMASVFGVLTFILVHWILPYAIDEWKNRPVYIGDEIGSIYTINFQDEYDRIKRELHLGNQYLRLEDFRVEYVKDGRITDLSWQLLEQNGNGYNLYYIRYDTEKSSYQVTKNQLEGWFRYDQLIEANHFFENLIVLNIKDVTNAKDDFPFYVIRSTGVREHYFVEEGTHYFLSNGEIQLLDERQLPAECYYISTFAMKKTKEVTDDQGMITQESFEGTGYSNYLIDVKFVE